MSVKTYTVAMQNGPPVTRKGHIVTFTRAGHPAVAVALYKTRGGYNADHPRTGRSISAFDQVCRFGKAVLLREAKDSLLLMLDELKGDEALRRVADSYPVLNPDFPLIKVRITTLDSG
jgi:hypothetical protein